VIFRGVACKVVEVGCIIWSSGGHMDWAGVYYQIVKHLETTGIDSHLFSWFVYISPKSYCVGLLLISL
jgi:hypothetical protein